ncbi:MAG: glutathione S-transferase family protein [Gammaproteobacteria bacterium]|nr:glutathione S-transferase family protein [Gammaproteobacteria bacterium]
MKLYNLPPGMNPRRVRIFLSEKGVEVPTVDIDMQKGENATPEFLAMNPLGTLPVLELDDGTILTESVAICRYFEELHPAPTLFGDDPLSRAQTEMWNRRVELELLAPLSQAFRHLSPFWKGRLEQLPEFGAMAQQNALKTMAWFDKELTERPYVAGQSYSVADISAQCAILLGKNTGTPIPDELDALQQWWKRVSSRPSARA